MTLRARCVLPLLTLFAWNAEAQVGTALGPGNSRATSTAKAPGSGIDAWLGGASWTVNPPIPEPRGTAQGSTVASSDGSLIYHIEGGCCSIWPDAIDRVWAYLPADGSWLARSNFPLTTGIRSYGSAVELNGFIYVFGGLTGPFFGSAVLNTTWIYDEANGSKVRICPMLVLVRQWLPMVSSSG